MEKDELTFKTGLLFSLSPKSVAFHRSSVHSKLVALGPLLVLVRTGKERRRAGELGVVSGQDALGL